VSALKYQKIIFSLITFFVIASIILPLFAVNDFISDTSNRITASGSTEINDVRDRAWGSIKLILQVAAIAAILLCGLKYMFASPDQKADIKKSLGVVVLGSAIVFGTTLVIDFVQAVSGDLFEIR